MKYISTQPTYKPTKRKMLLLLAYVHFFASKTYPHGLRYSAIAATCGVAESTVRGYIQDFAADSLIHVQVYGGYQTASLSLRGQKEALRVLPCVAQWGREGDASLFLCVALMDDSKESWTKLEENLCRALRRGVWLAHDKNAVEHLETVLPALVCLPLKTPEEQVVDSYLRQEPCYRQQTRLRRIFARRPTFAALCAWAGSVQYLPETCFPSELQSHSLCMRSSDAVIKMR